MKASHTVLYYHVGQSSGHEYPRPAGARNAGEKTHLAPGGEKAPQVAFERLLFG